MKKKIEVPEIYQKECANKKIENWKCIKNLKIDH